MGDARDRTFRCYSTNAGPTEATLGFGVSLGFSGETLEFVRSPFEALSFDAFVGTEVDLFDQPPPNGGWRCVFCRAPNHAMTKTCMRCNAAEPLRTAPLLPVSQAKLGLRKSRTGTSFTHFLPLFLTEDHFNPTLAARCLQAMWCRVPLDRIPEAADAPTVAEAVWHILPALLSSAAAMAASNPNASHTALRGYLQVHRLIVALATHDVRDRAEEIAGGFARSPARRARQVAPHLTHLLARLLLSKDPLLALQDTRDVILQEALDRAAGDALGKGLEADSPKYAQVFWAAASSNLRVLLVSVRLLQYATTFDGDCGEDVVSCDANKFQEEVRSAASLGSWPCFAELWRRAAGEESAPEGRGDSLALRLAGPNLLEALRGSEANALRRGYYKTWGSCLRSWATLLSVAVLIMATVFHLRFKS